MTVQLYPGSKVLVYVLFLLGNFHTHIREGYWKFQGGGESKANIFNEKHELKLEFPEGWAG